MAVDKHEWGRWKREHEAFHLTAVVQGSAGELEQSILALGLLPGDGSGSGVSATVGGDSRPGFVYLATREYLDEMMIPARGVLFSVDLDALDPALVYADEDLAGFRYSLYREIGIIPDGLTLSAWAHKRNFGAARADVAFSLALGAFAYRGTVAAEALRVVDRDYTSGQLALSDRMRDLYDEGARRVCDEWGMPFMAPRRRLPPVPLPPAKGLHGVVPDAEALRKAVLQRAPSAHSPIHGLRHWSAVAEFGDRICRAHREVDPAVVFLFAFLHDAMRENEGFDPEHGARAARLAEILAGDVFFPSPRQLEQLVHACRDHTHVDHPPDGDMTVGACWDADRLDLWRVGIEPDPARMNTPHAREPATINELFAALPAGWA